ncbi:aminoglycoside phosphotransferase [Streptomyces sp. NPDC058861]|uniref:aminoglycoside phosphotransferase n=1 Tax=Streptomyces sp. NPDC058861 TaxID=3346653 RepID=UPI0036C2B9F2
MTKLGWTSLPSAVRTAVEARVGPVSGWTAAATGMNSTVAGALHTSAGPVFVKAAEHDHPWAAQHTEAAINPHVAPVSPRLLLHIDSGGWDVLVFEFVPGRSADLGPGSPDLIPVADVVAALGRLPLPDLALPTVQEHFATGNAAPDLDQLAGRNLLHLDLNPDNIRVGTRARIVDWASPTVGAAWVDVAGLILRLLDAGHTPESADRWARRLPAWRSAPPAGVAVHAAVNARAWATTAQRAPFPWAVRLAGAAERWLHYRRRLDRLPRPGDAQGVW